MEVKLTGDQEDDCLDSGQTGESARTALGGLEQAVDGLQEAVGLAGLRPSHDALQVAAYESGDLLHRFDLAAHHTRTPVFEHAAHDVDLFTIEDLAQLLLVEPCSSRTYRSHLGDQSIQVSGGFRLQFRTILQQRPAHSFEGRVGALLEAARPVHRRAGVPNDMEFVEGDASVRQFLAYPVDEGRRHVDADRLDLLGWAAMRVQIVGQFLDGLGIAPLGDEQHSACERVSGQGDVVVAARTRRLIDGQCGYVAKVGQAQGEVHVALAHRHHAVRRLTDDARHGRERHLLCQHQDHRFEQQGEAGQAAREVRLDQSHRAIGQLHTRRAHLQAALVLEEVQVPIGLGHRVMYRMHAFMTPDREAAARLEVDQHRQHFGGLIEFHCRHRPRRGNPQRHLKQLGRHTVSLTHNQLTPYYPLGI